MKNGITIGHTMVAVVIILLMPPALAGETYLDKARVLHTQPLYRTRAMPVRTEVCVDQRQTRPDAMNPRLLGNARLNDPSLSLLDALREDIELRQPEKPGHRCQTVTQTEAREEIIAYQVRYQYGKAVYQERMDQDPGDFVWVRVRVSD